MLLFTGYTEFFIRLGMRDTLYCFWVSHLFQLLYLYFLFICEITLRLYYTTHNAGQRYVHWKMTNNFALQPWPPRRSVITARTLSLFSPSNCFVLQTMTSRTIKLLISDENVRLGPVFFTGELEMHIRVVNFSVLLIFRYKYKYTYIYVLYIHRYSVDVFRNIDLHTRLFIDRTRPLTERNG